MTKPAVTFAAKSTNDPHGSIPTQLADGRELAEREGWTVVAEFKDEAFSAYSGNRGPDLAAAMSEVERLADEHGEAALIVQHSDRLARGDGKTAKHLVEYVLWALKHDVTILSGQDPQTFGDLLYAVVTGQRNHEDSKRKGQATAAGMKRSAADGYSPGGRCPYGYEREPLGQPEPGKRQRWVYVRYEPEAAIVRRIYDDFLAGVTQCEIAARLNAEGVTPKLGGRWHQSSISQVLANPVYRGDRRSHGEVVAKGKHEAIIDPDTWTRAEQLRKASARTTGHGGGRRPKGTHLFAKGTLRCGICGEAMDCTTKPTKTPDVLYEVYSCSGRRRRLRFGDGGVCPQMPVKRALIDGAAWRYFQQVGLDLDATRAAVLEAHDSKLSEVRALREHAEGAVLKAEDRLTRVRRAFQDGHLDPADWTEQREQLSAEQNAARAEVERLAAQEQAHDREAAAFDAEGTVLNELAAMRALIAGEAQQGSREGLDAFRAALLRLFESFTLYTEPAVFDFTNVEPLEPGDPRPRHVEHEALRLSDDGPLHCLLPKVREEAVERWRHDRGVDHPELRRVAAEIRESASRRVHLFPRCRAACASSPRRPRRKARLPTGEPRARLLPSSKSGTLMLRSCWSSFAAARWAAGETIASAVSAVSSSATGTSRTPGTGFGSRLGLSSAAPSSTLTLSLGAARDLGRGNERHRDKADYARSRTYAM